MTIIQFDGRRRRKISPASVNSLFDTHIPLFSDDIFVEYTRARLLQGPQVPEIILPSRMDRSLFNKAFMALATTFFGVEHKEKSVLSQGLLQYGDALSNVHQALGDPLRYHSYDLIDSITTMTLFEVRSFPLPPPLCLYRYKYRLNHSVSHFRQRAWLAQSC